MMRIELLPARCGDCILVEYGPASARVLIDTGFVRTFEEAIAPRLAQIDATGEPVALELLVVTHIDRDHIRGAIPLLQQSPAKASPAEVWFNGKKHLADELGVQDGTVFAALLEERFADRWNKSSPFAGKAVKVPEHGALPTVTLPGGATITLLSPYQDALTKLDAKWNDVLGSVDWDEAKPVIARDPKDDTLGQRDPVSDVSAKAIRKLAAKAVYEDRAEANGSSIAFLFEYDGNRVLFTGDAHPSVLLRSLERYSPGKKVELAAFKLSHHGSATNLSDALLEKIDCTNWLVSTDGSSFGHPHGEAIARLLVREGAKTLYFNAATEYTTVWNNDEAKGKLKYRTVYPERTGAPCVLELK